MNVVLLVVDSLRARSLALDGDDAGRPQTPFLARLARESTSFTRAYATECWTLPAHCSMFTGALPSEHGAHFQSMGYAGAAPTAAEILSAAGYHTEVVTRNSIFDGSLPGITRGFRRNTRVFAARSGLNPLSVMLAMSKPRFRRQILTSGFFHARQRESRAFVTAFARATVPADREALAHVLEVMTRCRAQRTPYFVFCNLYDVHAPYPPAMRSIFRPVHLPANWPETLMLPFVLPSLGGHAYLREGFRLSASSRRMLLARYHAAVALMDAKAGGRARPSRADQEDGPRAAGHRADRLRRESGDRRLLAGRRRVLGGGRRDPLPGRGDHHRGQSARHVPFRRGDRVGCAYARFPDHRIDARRGHDDRRKLSLPEGRGYNRRAFHPRRR